MYDYDYGLWEAIECVDSLEDMEGSNGRTLPQKGLGLEVP